MKRNFDFSLSGKSFFLLFYGYFLIVAAYEAALFLTYRLYSLGELRLSVYMAVVFGGVALILVLSVIFQVLFARKIIPALSFDSRPFGFNGKVGAFFGINLLGWFFSAITLGIYFPWYVRKITAYMVAKTEFDGTEMEFQSRGGKLFLILLATLVLPVAIVIILTAVWFYLSGTDSASRTENNPVVLAITVVLYILLIPFFYKFYQWYFNGLAWNGLRLHWDTKFWRSCFFLLIQMTLTILTLGIYFPAALVRSYRYFSSRALVLSGESGKGRLAFNGRIGKGFLLIWGQLLLSIVTLFIYFPWAFVKVLKWFAVQTEYIKQE